MSDEVSMSAPRHLLLSVDDVGSALDTRLALAVLAAEPHNRVYVGTHDSLMHLARRIKGGVYLGTRPLHSRSGSELDDYHFLKQRNFIFVHFDSQGAVYPGGERRWRAQLRERLDPRQLDARDYICTCGHFQRDFYRELNPPCRDNIRTTGHPRLDLYRRRWRPYYNDHVNRLRAQFGDFLLVNTDLARANGGFNIGNTHHPRLADRYRDIHQWAHENETLSYFVRLIHRLHIVFPDLPIVVRPQNGEDPEFYHLVFQGLSSVHVLDKGPAAPWILASRCVIHSGCVAGLKAHLGAAPNINFRPIDDPQRILFLPDQFGVVCNDIDQVVECLIELFHTEALRTSFDDPPLIDHRAKRLLNNLCAPSLPNILAVLQEAQLQVGPAKSAPELALRTEQTLLGAVRGIKRTIRPLSPIHDPVVKEASNICDGFDGDDIARRIEGLQTLAGRRVDHRLIGPRLMVVETR